MYTTYSAYSVYSELRGYIQNAGYAMSSSSCTQVRALAYTEYSCSIRAVSPAAWELIFDISYPYKTLNFLFFVSFPFSYLFFAFFSFLTRTRASSYLPSLSLFVHHSRRVDEDVLSVLESKCRCMCCSIALPA